MIININTDTLIQTDLDANDYLVANLVYERFYNTLESLKLRFPQIIQSSFKNLMDKGLITTSTSRIGYSVTEKFLENIASKDLFDELLETFPAYVVRTSGAKDYLRIDKDKNRKKYKKITKNKKSIHSHIIKCLKFEIASRQNENSMPYMRRLTSWIDGKEWEVWAERLENESTISKTETYGTELE